MESLPKELINDILQFNKYPHEVYKICYFEVDDSGCGGGITNVCKFFEVVNESEYNLDTELSTIKKSFLDEILSTELPHHFCNYAQKNKRVPPGGDDDVNNGHYGDFEPIIHKIMRIN